MKVHRIAILLSSLALAGCISIPQQGNVKDSEMEAIRVGISTLDEVIEVAGSPVGIWDVSENRVAVFNDGATESTVPLVGNLLFPSVYRSEGEQGDYEAFLVLVDKGGVVQRIEKKDHPKDRNWPVFVREWAAEQSDDGES